MTDTYLTPPSFALWKDYRAACQEFRKRKVEDFSYPHIRFRRQFERYLENAEVMRRGDFLPEGAVPSLEFWLTDGRRWLAGGNVRPFINEQLLTFGGHIGYCVRPSEWRKGLGTRLLSLLLDEARAQGTLVARITCFDENAGSAKVIEKNGGILVDKVYNEIRRQQRLTRLYDIIL